MACQLGLAAGAKTEAPAAGRLRCTSPASNHSSSHDPRTKGRKKGVIDVEARVRSRAEDMWTWTVDARDGAGRPCALSRVTVAVRAMAARA